MSEQETNAIKEDDVDSALESAQYEASLRQKRKLHEVILELIRLFVDICEAEKLTYFMSGGTMLGAVRHKGFIPWDDDADFGMPRPDYDKFYGVANKYLPPNYKLVTYESDDDYRHYYGKLIDLTTQISVNAAHMETQAYIWIDIHPLDGVPKHILTRQMYKLWILYNRMMFSTSNFAESVDIHRPNRPWYEIILMSFVEKFQIEKLLSSEKRYFKLDKALRLVPYENAKYIANMMGIYKLKEIFPKSVFGEGCLYEFEGMMLNGPQDYDAYLSQLYGSYMDLPPTSDREHHYISMTS